MTLVDEHELFQEQEKKRKIFRLIIKIIVILFIFMIALLVLMKVKNSKSFKFVLDGETQSGIDTSMILKNEKGKFVEENGEIFVSVQKLSSLLQYQYYNSEYKLKGEDKTKCQIRSGNIYTSYIADSNKLYKAIVKESNDNDTSSKNNNNSNKNQEEAVQEDEVQYEYFTIANNVKIVNDEIFVSLEGIRLGFDISISYDKKTNTLSIVTLDKLEQVAKSKRSDIVSSGEYEYINKRLFKYGMGIVKDSSGNLGVGSYTNSDKLSTYVASCKYSDIKFNEGTKTFTVITSSDNKKCILYVDLNAQEVKKNITCQYNNIKEIDNEFKYFVIEDNGKYGIIDSDGKIALYPLFEEIGLDDGLYINIDNKYILNNKYVPVKNNGKWGLYSIEGQKLIEPQFEDIGCTLAQNGESVAIIPDIKENVDAVVFLYNAEKKLYGLYNASTGDKIAISLIEVFKKQVDGQDKYYINYVIDKENGVVHKLDVYTDI